MKKVAPEVRMTEAARKRSAKIRQDKESAENKGPASPRLRTPITQLPRGKNTENRSLESWKMVPSLKVFNIHVAKALVSNQKIALILIPLIISELCPIKVALRL